MYIDDFIWLPGVIEKLSIKHRVTQDEVEFEVRAKQRRRITLDPEIYARVEVQARTRGISPETLINLWVVERLQVGGGG